MTDIFDMIHYLIGFIILGFLIWLIIQIHNYFSKDNISIETLVNKKS
jgi:large-conductance mechanosensitive channel